MKRLTTTTMALFLMGAAAAAEPLTAAETLAIKDRAAAGAFTGRAEWNALTFYLQGVIEGAAAYQRTLMEQNKTPLFCPPPRKSYSIEEMIAYLSKSDASEKSRPATRVVLDAYARDYPCKE